MNPTGVIGVTLLSRRSDWRLWLGVDGASRRQAKPGYRFVQWQSDGSASPVLCDGANGSITYTGTACQFAT